MANKYSLHKKKYAAAVCVGKQAVADLGVRLQQQTPGEVNTTDIALASCASPTASP